MADFDIDVVSESPVVIEFEGEVKFPANLYAGGGLTLTKNGLDYTFSVDLATLAYPTDFPAGITVGYSVDIGSTGYASLYLDGGSGNSKSVWTYTNGVTGWNFGEGTGGAWYVDRFNGAGAYLDTPLLISKSTGVATFLQRPVFGAATPWDSANFNPTLKADKTYVDAGLPGAVVNSVSAAYTTNANLTAIIPGDDTIPQITEGTQILSATITPKTATNKLRVRFTGFGSVNAIENWAAALFVNGGANAVRASYVTVGASGWAVPVVFEYEYVPGSTSLQTLSVRVGPFSAVTLRLNGVPTSRVLGGAMAATLVIEEIAA